jgi:hypothetical protein
VIECKAKHLSNEDADENVDKTDSFSGLKKNEMNGVLTIILQPYMMAFILKW